MNVQGVSSTPVQQTASTTSISQTDSTNQSAVSSGSTANSSSINSTTDTVTISSAAKAAYEEATETPEDVVTEARNGDRYAQQLLAKQAAAQTSAQEVQKK